MRMTKPIAWPWALKTGEPTGAEAPFDQDLWDSAAQLAETVASVK